MNQHARQYCRQSSRPAGPGRLYPGQPTPIVQFGTGSTITTVPESPSRTAGTCLVPAARFVQADMASRGSGPGMVQSRGCWRRS